MGSHSYFRFSSLNIYEGVGHYLLLAFHHRYSPCERKYVFGIVNISLER